MSSMGFISVLGVVQILSTWICYLTESTSDTGARYMRLTKYSNRLPRGLWKPFPSYSNVTAPLCGSNCRASLRCRSFFLLSNGDCLLLDQLLNDNIYHAGIHTTDEAAYYEPSGEIHNIALQKPTNQVGMLTGYPSLSVDSSRAVDGLRNGDRIKIGSSYTYSCWMADPGFHYMYVDLQDLYFVSLVRIMARYNCCEDRFEDLTIKVGESLSSMKKCSYFKGPPTYPGEVVVLPCKSVGRYVQVERTSKKHLTLCELEVSGSKVTKD